MKNYIYITEHEEICDRCGKHLPAGTACEATEDNLYCLTCVNELESRAENSFEDFRENQLDDVE
jgi:hypothetical protein